MSIIQSPTTFSLTGPDPTNPGVTITVATNDPKYYPLYTIFQAQQAALQANGSKRDQYLHALDSYQQLVDSGRAQGATPPVKPTMTVVSDVLSPSGIPQSTEQPFSPPLPDPVLPNLVPSAGGSIVNTTNRPPDPNAVLALHTQMLQQILNILNKGGN